MKPWAIWLIRRRVSWLLKVIIASCPIHILAYWERAWDDVAYTLTMIDTHKHKEQK